MEVVIELLLEFFGETVLQVVFEALASAGIHLWRNHDGEPSERRPITRMFGYTLFGLVVGGLSLLMAPESFARTQSARLFALFVAPIAAGAAMALVGAWRRRHGQVVIGLDRFLYGYCFAFAMAAVRYLWAN